MTLHALLTLSLLTTAAPLERAAEDGYAPRPEQEQVGSALGGLIAAGPGFFIHGLGHYYIEREESALKLLLVEALGLGLIILGELIEEEAASGGSYTWLGQGFSRAGALLFLGSWGVDLLGSFKGDSPFEPDNTRIKDAKLSLAYRYTGDELTRFRHHMSARLRLDSGLVFVEPSLELEAGLNTRRADLDAGLYLMRGSWLSALGDPQNSLRLGARMHRVETPLYGVARHGGEAYLRWKFDLGLFIPTMRSLYIINEGGYGASYYQLSPQTGEVVNILTDSDFRDTFITWTSGIELNAGAQTHFSLLFIQDPNLETSPFSTQVGVLEGALEHRYEDDLDIEARVTAGDGWAVWLELGYQL